MDVYTLTYVNRSQVLLPGKSHGQRSLVGRSPWGCQESDTTEWLHFHFSLSCVGEGNGNPLQCSCLENPRDGGAWWAAVYGIAQSRTRLKWLSSSSSSAKFAVWLRKLQWGICNNLKEYHWVGGGRKIQDRRDIYTPMVSSHCYMTEIKPML